MVFRMMRAAATCLLFLAATGAFAGGGPMRVELRLGDDVVVIDDARVVERDGTLTIEAVDARVPSGSRCDVKLGGAVRASLGSLVANHVSIYMDGNSRITIESLTTESLETTVDRFGRVDVQASE